MSELQTRTLKFTNGHTIPVVGLGTWKSTVKEVEEAVTYAIEAGYRHIDTAFAYLNEVQVGNAIKTCIDGGVVKREELFVTSKLWCTYHRPELVEDHLRESLTALQLDYLDLYLMHWPIALQEGKDLAPKDEKGDILHLDIDYLDTFKAMAKLVDAGLVRSIGVSNFNREQVQRILDSDVKDYFVNLQVEISPYLSNTELLNWAVSKGIVVTAYSQFGSPDRPWAKASDRVLLNEEKVKVIAKNHERTAAQVVLRWGLQRGCVTIPKSVSRARIVENSKIFDFELSPDEMKTLGSFEQFRALTVPWFSGNKHYPF